MANVCDMRGHATRHELEDLYYRLKIIKSDKDLDNPYALFVIGTGFLNGREALAYLEKKLGGHNDE